VQQFTKDTQRKHSVMHSSYFSCVLSFTLSFSPAEAELVDLLQ